MFTGIIQEVGRVGAVGRKGGNSSLMIESGVVGNKLERGASVAVNGVCLTIVDTEKGSFRVDVIEETLSRTNLGELRIGSSVNIEAPVTPSSMIHGHLVQGHVDCTGIVADRRPVEGSIIFEIQFPAGFSKYVIEKGSVAVEGISLTVVVCGENSLSVAIIPHTLEKTNLKYKAVGDTVNLEFDMIARYIEKMILPGRTGLTYSFLKEHGFG